MVTLRLVFNDLYDPVARAGLLNVLPSLHSRQLESRLQLSFSPLLTRHRFTLPYDYIHDLLCVPCESPPKMPVAPTVKSARTTSVYERSCRASASPKSSRRSSSQTKAKIQAVAAPIPQPRPVSQHRKVEEVMYFEEDYSEEIIAYMSNMDVSLFLFGV